MLETDGPGSFEKHCNVLLKSNCGLDVPDFLRLVLDGVSAVAATMQLECNRDKKENSDCMTSKDRQFINLTGVCQVLRDALLSDFDLYPLKAEEIRAVLQQLLKWSIQHPTEPSTISETSLSGR